MRSSTPNVDLQATVSEVRPDGMETFVQNGWLRANERKLDPRKSTPLEPVLEACASLTFRPFPATFVKVTVPLYYEGHAYRAGSRIRVTLSAPGGSSQPIWAFDRSPEGNREGRDSLLEADALKARSAGRARGQCADRPAAVSGPAG